MVEATNDAHLLSIEIIGLNYAPEPVGIGPYTAGLAQSLSAQGHDVQVITGRPYYPDWRPFGGSSAGWRRTSEESVTVTRCPHYIPRVPTGFKRILHHASFALTSLFPALRATRSRPDIVIAIAPSLLSLPIAWIAAKLARAKLWVHIQDLELETALATGLIKESSLGVRFARKVESWILRLADRASSISPQMCAKLIEKGVSADKVRELRNWANHEEAFHQPPKGDFREEWHLGDRKVVLYSGNIANKQGLSLVVDAARMLDNREDIAFVICGQGPYRAELERRAEGLKNIQFHDLQPADQVGEMLSIAHVHVLPQLADAADLVLPSKLTNMLASGRPVLATAARGTGLAAEVAGCGDIVPPGDVDALANAIVRFVDDQALADSYGAEAAHRAHERWSKELILSRFESQILETIASRNNGLANG